MTQTLSDQLLLALLRKALSDKNLPTELFAAASPEDWDACYRVAAAQGVSVLAMDAVLQLPASCQPPWPLKVAWAMEAEKYEEQYRCYCRRAEELMAFYARHHIAAVQLKGVGFSPHYPIPAHREGGDIDLFTYSADPSLMGDSEANHLADELMEQQDIEVDCTHSQKHSVFYYHGIPVENHKTFINSETYALAAKMDPVLRRLLEPQEVTLCGEYRIHTPSPAFNTLFLAFHAAQHYTYGLKLHHLCDWACLLHRHGLHLPEELTDRRFIRFVHALTQVCNDYLGTNIPLPTSDRRLSEEIIREVLHPKFTKETPEGRGWEIFVFKFRRLRHRYHLCNHVFHVSWLKWFGRAFGRFCRKLLAVM